MRSGRNEVYAPKRVKNIRFFLCKKGKRACRSCALIAMYSYYRFNRFFNISKNMSAVKRQVYTEKQTTKMERHYLLISFALTVRKTSLMREHCQRELELNGGDVVVDSLCTGIGIYSMIFIFITVFRCTIGNLNSV